MKAGIRAQDHGANGERVVPIFIGRGAPFRDTLLTPNLAVLPMRAVEFGGPRTSQFQRVAMTS